MELQYNIYFEVAAFLFMAVLAYYVRWQYNMTTSKNRSFFRMLLFVIAANFMDVLTAITISYAPVVPYWLNMVLNGIYFSILVFLSVQFLDYSFELTDKDKLYSASRIFEAVVCIFCVLLLVVNCFTGVCFDFVNDKYVHGPLYLVIYIVPYIMLVLSAIVVFRHFKRWEMSRRISVIIYYALCMSGFFLQLFFFPTVLLNLFTLSLSVVIILFAMETTDYQELVHTLEEMRILNAKTHAAMETKRRFIDNISTNIRGPVKNIVSYNESLLKQLTDDEARNLVMESQKTATSLIGVIDDIIDYSESEIQDIEIDEELYEVKTLVETCVSGLKNAADAKNIELIIEFDRTLPAKLFGDRDKITQILREVIVNAINYTDEGSVTVKTTWKDYDRRHILLLFSVEDTGRGIPEELKNSLFELTETERFTRIENNEKRIGLGLALTKRMIELMNGDIGFYSTEGEGTLFYIEFPQKIFED